MLPQTVNLRFLVSYSRKRFWNHDRLPGRIDLIFTVLQRRCRLKYICKYIMQTKSFNSTLRDNFCGTCFLLARKYQNANFVFS